MKSIGYTVKQVLSQEAKNMHEKLDNEEKLINYRKLNFKGGNNVDYDFSKFSSLKELFRVIYFGEIVIPATEREQDEFNSMLEVFRMYRQKRVQIKKT